jgi:Pyocin activator protein PrtN
MKKARRRASATLLLRPVFRLGGQKSPWPASAADLAALIDRQRVKAGGDGGGLW